MSASLRLYLSRKSWRVFPGSEKTKIVRDSGNVNVMRDLLLGKWLWTRGRNAGIKATTVRDSGNVNVIRDLLLGKWSWKRGRNVGSGPTFPDTISSQLKQQQRRRLRKRHLKSEFALPQTISRLLHLVEFVKYWSWVLKDYIKVQVKKGQFPSSTN